MEVAGNSSNVVVDGNDASYQHVHMIEKHSRISMKRMFLPVGQGAFYLERFSAGESGRPVNVVYDCGTLSGLAHLKKIINHEFNESDVVEALFISHLHEDHINGIPFLMERCHVRRVYLPLISPVDLALMRLDFETRNRSSSTFDKLQIGDEVLMSEEFVRGMFEHSRITLFETSRRYNRDTMIFELDSFSGGIMQQGTPNQGVRDLSAEIFGGTGKEQDKAVWRYKTFCIRNEDAVNSVMRKFAATFTGEATPARIAELVKEGCKDKEIKKKIRGLYDSIKGHFNSHSLTMCSESVNANDRQKFECELDKDVAPYALPTDTASGCLYTGDFEAANLKCWNQLHSAYNDSWRNVGCVQIPHHGSPHSFNDAFLTLEAYHVISAGLGNNHHHPSRYVLWKYQRRNIVPFVVTQDPRSKISMNVSLKNTAHKICCI